ncbi:hypothetical protein NPIL_617521 [Nephila pilipes]|uniref:Uncharacterized protein n=1 Tax=Nephila pilipes TaxID=299642 RepID=A0A8X6T9R6_NEPPI|nr:hypothetical protein NPIL_617521 [Nephila pilipes]
MFEEERLCVHSCKNENSDEVKRWKLTFSSIASILCHSVMSLKKIRIAHLALDTVSRCRLNVDKQKPIYASSYQSHGFWATASSVDGDSSVFEKIKKYSVQDDSRVI